MRLKTPHVRLFATALALALVSPSAALAGPERDLADDGRINNPCQYSDAELRRAQEQIPADRDQYTPGDRAELEAARAARARGDCDRGRVRSAGDSSGGGAPGASGGPGAGTSDAGGGSAGGAPGLDATAPVADRPGGAGAPPAPPPVAKPGLTGAPAPAVSTAVTRGSDVPAAVWILGLLALLCAIAGAAMLAARRRGGGPAGPARWLAAVALAARRIPGLRRARTERA